jgi:hypothetical protein
MFVFIAATIALAAVALALGAIFVAFGIVLLLGLAAVGTVVGAGVLVFRRLTGRVPGRPDGPRFDTGLDPSLEVFPGQASRTSVPRELSSRPVPKPAEPDQPA